MRHTFVAFAYTFAVAVSGVVNGQMAFDKVTWIDQERPTYPSCGDLNHDGVPDLCVSYAGAFVAGTPQWRAYLGVGDGTFQAPVVMPTGNTTLPGSVEICDFDNDGTLDAITGFANKPKFWIQYGLGDGTFTAAKECPLVGPIGDLVSVDIDRDGWLDLVGLTFNPSPRLHHIRDDDAGGVYAHNKSWGNIEFGSGLALVDFDTDGYMDVVVSDKHLGPLPTVFRFRNTTAGTLFPIQPELPSTPHAGKIIADDIDKDRRTDLILENENLNQVSVMRGLGDMQFAPPVQFPTGLETVSLTLADLDGDGNTDVVVGGNDVAKTFLVLPGDGRGQFGAPQSFPLTGRGFSPVPVDLNLDGRCDLISVSGFEKAIDFNFNATKGHPESIPIGSGTPTCQGIMTMGLAKPASVSTGAATLTCTNTPSRAWGVALVGTTVDPNGADSIGHGVEVYVDIFQSNWVAIGFGWGDSSGTAGFPMELPADPGAVGMQLCAQSFWNEPLNGTCSTSFDGTSSSRGMTFNLEP
jgi:hypothetical protein